MYVATVYSLIVLIWGSTWYVISFQVGGTAPEVSVAIRFVIAGVLLLLWALLRGKSITLKRADVPWILAQGALMYSINYVVVYIATEHVTTGLIAVLFALIIPFNLLHEWMFYKKAVEARVAIAAMFGIGGVALIFLPGIMGTELDPAALRAIIVVVVGVWVCSLGNMLAIRSMGLGYSIVTLNGHGMLLAGCLTGVYAFLIGRPMTIEWSPSYFWSLLYLAIFGSAVAFGGYLALLERIGSARAAYSTVMFPVVALIISAIFEDYRPSLVAIIGVVLTVIGNTLIIGRPSEPTAAAPASEPAR